MPGQPDPHRARCCPGVVGVAMAVCKREVVSTITFGRQVTGDVDAASSREWLIWYGTFA